jgi:uncharacterized protein DUF5666
MRRTQLLATALVAVLAFSAGCGGESPTEPSSEGEGSNGSPSEGSESATGMIRGVLLSGAGGTTGGPLEGVRVTLVETSIASVTDSRGRFVLRNVPAGDAPLEFVGSSVNARLQLETVRVGEQISLTAVARGEEIDVAKESRVDGGDVQVEGRITAVNAGARAFDIEDVHVTVPAGTPIEFGGQRLEVSDLHAGDRVLAAGSGSVTSVTAREVVVQQSQGAEAAQISGVVADLAGACPTRTFRLGSTLVRTSDATTFADGSCDDLASGRRVEARGVARAGEFTASAVTFLADEPAQGEALGTVSELAGSCPDLRFTVGGKRIATSGETEYVGGTCSQVAAGATVSAHGPLDGSTINARVVRFEESGGSGESR